MLRYVIRHGECRGELNGQPTLSPQAKGKARELGQDLVWSHGREAMGSVAVSLKLRTMQTAEAIGFLTRYPFASLNEIEADLPRPVIRQKLESGDLEIMDLARTRATALFENPPPYQFLVTHGALMVGMADVLGIQFHTVIPDFLEVREMYF